MFSNKVKNLVIFYLKIQILIYYRSFTEKEHQIHLDHQCNSNSNVSVHKKFQIITKWQGQ